jgi:hypothetical protein
MIGAERLGDDPRVGELVLDPVAGKADGKRLHRFRHVP